MSNNVITLLSILEAITQLHDETARILNENGMEPLDNSQAAIEMSSFAEPESIRTVLGQGSMLIEVSADHLIALTRVLSDPVLTISPWTCTRSILESSALATWLLDPEIGDMERVSRSFAFRYEGLAQQKKWAKSAGLDTCRVDARMDYVEAHALNLGYAPLVNRRGNRNGIGQKMPTITQLVGSALDEETAYRLLSSIAHAHPWALQQSSFRQGEDVQGTASGEHMFAENSRVLERNIRTEAVVYLCHRAGYAFARAFWSKGMLFGYDLEEVRRTLDTAFDRLHYTADDRFWNEHL